MIHTLRGSNLVRGEIFQYEIAIWEPGCQVHQNWNERPSDGGWLSFEPDKLIIREREISKSDPPAEIQLINLFDSSSWFNA